MRKVRFLCAALGILLLLEIVFRLGLGLGDPPLVIRDADVEYRLVPSTEYTRFGNRISINRFGMRARDHAKATTDDERRILLIGDSVVYGNHFLDQRDTIAQNLTQELASVMRCTPIVMPAAASSWGPVNQAAFLEDVGTLDADLAILLLSGHDLYDTPTFKDAVIPYRLKPSFSAIHDAAQIAWERFGPNTSKQMNLPSFEARQTETLAALDKIKDQLQADEILLILVYHPTMTERTNGFYDAQAVLADWAQGHDVPVEALGSGLTPDFYRDDIHPNAAGAHYIARRFAQIVQPVLPPC